MIREKGLYNQIGQAFAALDPSVCITTPRSSLSLLLDVLNRNILILGIT
jgi:hypothetical protein